jgi:hypothetical protein
MCCGHGKLSWTGQSCVPPEGREQGECWMHSHCRWVVKAVATFWTTCSLLQEVPPAR